MEEERLNRSGTFGGKLLVQIVSTPGGTNVGLYTGVLIENPDSALINGFASEKERIYEPESIERLNVGDLFIFSKSAIFLEVPLNNGEEGAYIHLGPHIYEYINYQDVPSMQPQEIEEEPNNPGVS